MAEADLDIAYILKLTEDEVIVLRDILSNIAGYPSTRRGIADKIAHALDDIGVTFDGDDLPTDLLGRIEFISTEDSE